MRLFVSLLIISILLLVSCAPKGEAVIGNAFQTLSSPERMEYQECWADTCQSLMKVDQNACAQKCYDTAKSK